MKKKLIVSAILAFPLWILINKYLFDRSWMSSLVGAIVWEVIYVIGMIIFSNWWTRKAKAQSNN